MATADDNGTTTTVDHVDISDLFELFAQWLMPGGSRDFDGGVADITDLFEMFGNWGQCP